MGLATDMGGLKKKKIRDVKQEGYYFDYYEDLKTLWIDIYLIAFPVMEF